MFTRQQLLVAGLEHIKQWMEINNVPVPKINQWKVGDRMYYLRSCGLYMQAKTFGDGKYRERSINIMTDKCAQVDSGSVGGRNWSYPGYVIDRTPYGVLAHELGHYIDDYNANFNCFGYYSDKLRAVTREAALTNYQTNKTWEWFAEIFRLFVTNPDLLSKLRPLCYSELIRQFPRTVENKSWEEILKDAPKRTIEMTKKKIAVCDTSTYNEDEQRGLQYEY
jgi:hypothetical protein